MGGPLSGSALPGGALLEQLSAAQKKWGETVTEMLNKHRETLDAQYKAGIRTIEDAFKVGEAKDPQQFRRLTEELWKQSFECLKTVAESQMRDVQAAMQKVLRGRVQDGLGHEGLTHSEDVRVCSRNATAEPESPGPWRSPGRGRSQFLRRFRKVEDHDDGKH